jgi:transposase
MPKEQSPGKPTTRRYSEQEKATVVRMVRTLRAELGTEHGTVKRVADQLGYGIESVRLWVRRATDFVRERWFTGPEAVSYGLADEVIGGPAGAPESGTPA